MSSTLEGVRCTIRIHDDKHTKFGAHDLVVHCDLLDGLCEGGLIELTTPRSLSTSTTGVVAPDDSFDGGSSNAPEGKRTALILCATHITKERDVKVSVRASIAGVFSFRQGSSVVLKRIEEEEASIQYAEVVFKDQYFNPVDMWRMEQSLVGSCLYISKQLTFLSMRVSVHELLTHSGTVASSGYVTPRTKFVFRSRSARFCLLLQLSQEMWSFAPDGELYFEKAIQFLRVLFDKWKQNETSHKISIVLFARVFWPPSDRNSPSSITRDSSNPDTLDMAGMGAKIGHACDNDVSNEFVHPISGDVYEDYYRVITANDSEFDGDEIIMSLKSAFRRFPSDIDWDSKCCHAQHHKDESARFNSIASKGNLMEALNLALVDLDKPSVDIDLKHTGQGIIVVSAGGGFAEVDSRLEHITKQKVLDNGVGVDLVYLGQPPLHVVPLFRGFNVPSNQRIADTVYKTPHWLYISFFYGHRDGSTYRPPGIPGACDALCIGDGDDGMALNVKELSICGMEDGVSLDWMDQYDDAVFTKGKRGSSIDGGGAKRVRKGLRKRRNNEFNPFGPPGPDRTRNISSANRRRWAHLFHASIYDIIAKTEYAYAPNWMSLCKPASLPITTDYFPPQAVLDHTYLESPSMVSCVHGGDQFGDVSALLVELVSQRIGHGFQLVVPPHQGDGPTRASPSRTHEYRLAMGHVYHRLTVVGPNIEIKRYSVDPRHDKKVDQRYPSEHDGCAATGDAAGPRARDAPRPGGAGVGGAMAHKRQVYSYRYRIASAATPGFRPAFIAFKASKFNPHFWPTLDMMICNETKDLCRPLHYWSTSFIIPPVHSDAPAPRSLATRAFLSFLSSINRMLKRLSKDVVRVEVKGDHAHHQKHAVSPADPTDGGAPSAHRPAIMSSSISMPHIPQSMVPRRTASSSIISTTRSPPSTSAANAQMSTSATTNSAGPGNHGGDGDACDEAMGDGGAAMDARGKDHHEDAPRGVPTTTTTTTTTTTMAMTEETKDGGGGEGDDGDGDDGEGGNHAGRGGQGDDADGGAQADRDSVGGDDDGDDQPHLDAVDDESFPPPMRTIVARTPRGDAIPARQEWMVVRHSGTFDPRTFFHIEMRALVVTGGVFADFINGFERKAKSCGVTLLSCPTNLINKRVKKYSPFIPSIQIEYAPKELSDDERTREEKRMIQLFSFIRNAHDPPDRLGKEYMHFSGTLLLRAVGRHLVCHRNLLVSKALQNVGKGVLNLLQKYCEQPVEHRRESLEEINLELSRVYGDLVGSHARTSS